MPQHRAARLTLPRLIIAVLAAVCLTVGAAQPVHVTFAGTGDGSAQLSLPWTPGETWRLTGGPHSDTGSKARPWSAVDFQPASGHAGGKVRAARAGYVVRPCANMVIVRHADGWATSYYHVKDIAVSSGDWVDRGELLGYTSTAAGCGGYATGPHVHFSLMRYGEYVNIRDNVIGGWTVREGDSIYEGCLVKSGVRRCAPFGLILNAGLVGAR